MGFLNIKKLKNIGFKSLGENVIISDKTSIYNAQTIEIGNNVRIDDFCILSGGEGGIIVGNYIHIACYSSIIGQGKICLEDYANISSRVSIYSSSDDYSGETMTNPMIPDEFKTVDYRPVAIGRHAIIGCGSVILPGVKIGEGCAVGALSLVKEDCENFAIYAGVPACKKGVRRQGLLQFEKRFMEVNGRD